MNSEEIAIADDPEDVDSEISDPGDAAPNARDLGWDVALQSLLRADLTPPRQTKNAKEMTADEYRAFRRETVTAARIAAREPKPNSFSRSDRNLQEKTSDLGDFSAHDLNREELTNMKRKFSQLERVNYQRASQVRTLGRIKARQDNRSQK